MNKKSLKVLEFDKLMQTASRFASSKKAKNDLLNTSPIPEKNKLQRAINLTDEAYQILFREPNLHVGVIKELSESLNLAKIGSVLSPEDLLNVAGTLKTSRVLSDYIKNIQGPELSTPNLLEILKFISSFKNIEDKIFMTIISNTEIADNATKKLYSLRRAIENKKESIRVRLESMTSSQTMSKYLQDSIVTIREGRFVIPVKSEYKSKVDGLVHDKSKGGSTFYVEPSFVVEMNNNLRSLIIDEEEEVKRILAELSRMIGDRADAIGLTYESTCELDYVFAKGKFAHDLNSTKPIISDEKIIDIKQGRHPFISKDDCVPIDFNIGEDYKALIITGPNTGGKTVSIKTVALLTVMALSGFFVPARENSKFAVFDKIYADIGDEQSIDQSLSTFSSHMMNIVKMVESANENSLLLFDELGAGTDPTEGAALAISILNQVKEMGATVIATTHYSELKQFALINEGFKNASVEFDIEKLMPTYKLTIGIPGKSNAFEISRRLGLNEDIINSAKELLEHDELKFEDVLQNLEYKLSVAEKEREKAEIAKIEAQSLLKKAVDTENKSKEQREKIIAEAKQEARRIIANTKAEMDEALKEIKNLDKSINQNENVLKLKQKISKNDKENIVGLSETKSFSGEIPKKLKIGEDYFLLSINKNATLLDINEKTNELTVMAGAMKLFVRKDDLRVASKRAKKKKTGIYDPKNTLAYGTSLNYVKSSKNDIDLHGKDVLQALHELDKFMDEASLSGLKEVYVIHGLGSGKLKREVKNFLSTHPCVKRMRSGVQGEGGAGVTVVRMK